MFCMLTFLPVGITSFLFFYLNRGGLWKKFNGEWDPRRIFWTVLNITILCMGFIIVGLPFPARLQWNYIFPSDYASSYDASKQWIEHDTFSFSHRFRNVLTYGL